MKITGLHALISAETAMGSEAKDDGIHSALQSGAQELCPMNERACPALIEVNRLKAECKRLQEISRTDPLTRFFNLRHLLTVLSGEMERTRRLELPTGLVMIDLDHFKRINDSYGHEAGNRVLKWISSIILQNIRRIDIPCRYGGEEFAIILPATTLPHSVYAAERLRNALEQNPVRLDDSATTVTASFGVDVYSGGDPLSPDQFIERADRFLLEAKANGRNCVRYDQKKVRVVSTEVTEKERKALFDNGIRDD